MGCVAGIGVRIAGVADHQSDPRTRAAYFGLLRTNMAGGGFYYEAQNKKNQDYAHVCIVIILQIS